MSSTLDAEAPTVTWSCLTREANNLIVGASAVKSISCHQIMESLKTQLAKRSTHGYIMNKYNPVFIKDKKKRH